MLAWKAHFILSQSSLCSFHGLRIQEDISYYLSPMKLSEETKKVTLGYPFLPNLCIFVIYVCSQLCLPGKAQMLKIYLCLASKKCNVVSSSKALNGLGVN